MNQCTRCGIAASDSYPLDILGEHYSRDICIKLLRAELSAAETDMVFLQSAYDALEARYIKRLEELIASFKGLPVVWLPPDAVPE